MAGMLLIGMEIQREPLARITTLFRSSGAS
jgi:hypothetical protein